MTCIVGIESESGVVIGGDSAAVSGWDLTIRADQKVFTRGAYAFGFTSSYRMGQLLRYSGTLPEPHDWDVDRFMVDGFVPAVRTILRDGGWIQTSNSRDEGGTFLVGVSGRLYTVYSDFQIARSQDGYDAVGCGSALALGALHAMTRIRSTPEARVGVALTAAAHHSAGVAGPFHYVTSSAPVEARALAAAAACPPSCEATTTGLDVDGDGKLHQCGGVHTADGWHICGRGDCGLAWAPSASSRPHLAGRWHVSPADPDEVIWSRANPALRQRYSFWDLYEPDA